MAEKTSDSTILTSVDSFARAMLDAADLDDLLWLIAENVGKTLGFDDCVIYLSDAGELKQVASFGVKADGRKVSKPIVIEFGKGIVGTVAQTGIAEIVQSTRADPRYIFDQFSGLSELTVPLRYAGETIGVFDIESAVEDAFSKDDLTFLQTIANIATPRLISAQYLRTIASTQKSLEESNKLLKEKVDTLERNQQSLVQSAKMASIGQLASGIAHEINTPLGYSLSNLQTAESYIDELVGMNAALHGSMPETDQVSKARFLLLATDFSELLAETIEGLNSAKDIVADLRTVARIQDVDTTTLDINDCLQKTLSVYRNLFKDNVRLETNFSQSVSASGNPGKLNQVFANILINAVQALPNGGTVKVSTVSLDDCVLVMIEDDGEGITEDDLPHLFTPFFTTKPIGKGTGLGLSICYRIIVDEHGGEILVDSTRGCTKFSIKLPLNRDDGFSLDV
jgi:signal transduction histidine kinase